MKTEEWFTQELEESKKTIGFWRETLILILEERIYNLTLRRNDNGHRRASKNTRST